MTVCLDAEASRERPNKWEGGKQQSDGYIPIAIVARWVVW